MVRRQKRDPRAWRKTPEGQARYWTARAEAEDKANFLGLDVGLEANDLFQSWHIFPLPRPEHRFGHELFCEVIRPGEPRISRIHK